MSEKWAVLIPVPVERLEDEDWMAKTRRYLEGEIRDRGYEPIPSSFEVGEPSLEETAYQKANVVGVRMVGER